MRVLALNCGSSSIKSAVVDTVKEECALRVRVENLGTAASLEVDDEAPQPVDSSDRTRALQTLLEEIQRRMARSRTIEAVAHRVVHGGAIFTQPTLIDDTTAQALASLSSLAPLHNPPALEAIREARRLLPSVPHVAVFDTAFHTTLPAHAREYALPVSLTRQFGIRRFGFHGISHAYVMRATSAYMRSRPEDLRIISCHLGNGASVTAIEHGSSVETSMGMTPLEGLVMGTRCGDIDPGVLLHLSSVAGYEAASLQKLLSSESGLQGLTGTHDLKQIEQRAAQGDEGCRLAITLYSHRARKYVGAYAAVMGGVDVIAFTGGVGENSALMRQRIAQRLEFLGVLLNDDRNRDAKPRAGQVIEISSEQSRARLFVVGADEEVSIAREAANVCDG